MFCLYNNSFLVYDSNDIHDIYYIFLLIKYLQDLFGRYPVYNNGFFVQDLDYAV